MKNPRANRISSS